MTDTQARVLVLSLLHSDGGQTFTFQGREIRLRRLACGGDEQTAKRLIQAYDGKVEVIALAGMPGQLQLADAQTAMAQGHFFDSIARHTPVVDGSDIRDAFARWSLFLMSHMQAGLFNRKHVLVVPGLNYSSAMHAITHFNAVVRFADPALFVKILPVGLLCNRLVTHLLAPAYLQVLNKCERAWLRRPGSRQYSTAMQRLLDLV